jgi:hypothetical protein
MDLWTHHRWRFPLPARHKFPLDKYGLLAERVVADGLVTAGELHEAARPSGRSWLRCTMPGCWPASATDG